MLLKSEYNTDEEDDDDDNDSSTGNSDVEEEQSMPQPGTQAYQRLPSAVRQRLEQLAGQVESLIDENQKLKEVRSSVIRCVNSMLLLLLSVLCASCDQAGLCMHVKHEQQTYLQTVCTDLCSYVLQRLELETVATAVDGMCENSEMSAEDC